MEPKALEFESGGAASAVVRAYDRRTGQWSVRFDSPFWKAVGHAHELGRRGQGRRVAIVDSGCDLTIPRLRDRVDTAKSFVATPADRDPLGHGTAVALLISEVAPDCRLDIYQVAHEGRPDHGALIAALKAAADSDADVINVSISALSPFALTEDQLKAALADGSGSVKGYAREAPPCDLCAAATRAAAAGKLVFAAAGNTGGMVACPARAETVVAVGFAGKTDRVSPVATGGLQHSSFAALPGAAQSMLIDLSLAEINGVLGTSFASPLYAGVGALGTTPAELSGYIAAVAAAGLPQLLQGMIRSGQIAPDRAWIGRVDSGYAAAEAKLPHAHCDVQAELNPAAARSDPARCFACGVFAEPILVNHGLWLLETQQTAAAKSLLEAARAVAPWSADATANLGAAARELGDIPGAIAFYEAALRLRPGFKVYESELQRLGGRVPAAPRRESWWSRLWPR
jgi:hypothetical protein